MRWGSGVKTCFLFSANQTWGVLSSRWSSHLLFKVSESLVMCVLVVCDSAQVQMGKWVDVMWTVNRPHRSRFVVCLLCIWSSYILLWALITQTLTRRGSQSPWPDPGAGVGCVVVDMYSMDMYGVGRSTEVRSSRGRARLLQNRTSQWVCGSLRRPFGIWFTGKATVLCSPNKMVVALEKASMPDIDMNYLKLRDESCSLTSNGTHIIGTMSFSTCGTKLEVWKHQIKREDVNSSFSVLKPLLCVFNLGQRGFYFFQERDQLLRAAHGDYSPTEDRQDRFLLQFSQNHRHLQ